MRRFRWVIIPILFIVISTMLPLASTEAAQAETGKPGLEELTTGADSIIVGTVVERTSQWNDEHTQIYTSVVISVEESLKGEVSQDRITITVPGGEVGEIGQWVSHMPSFDRGERAVLFLKKLSKAKRPKAQLPEAQFEVYGGFRGKLAVKQGKVGNLPLAKFKGRVSQALQGQALPDGEIDLPSSPATFPFSYAGFKWPGSSPVVSYRINENTADCTGEGAAVQTAAATWTAAPANFSFSYVGATGATSVGRNYVNEIMWTTSLGGGTIAMATIWYSGSTILENDIQFNDNYAWFIGASAGAYDVETIALHELGHWLCLDDLYDGGDSAKVMYGYGITNTTKRALHADDIAGIQYIYGVAATAPTVTNSGGASDITSTTARLNGEVTSTGGENPTVHICWGDNDGGTTPGSWANDVNLGTKGTGTFYTDVSGLDTGTTTYYYRCYATNSHGTDWADNTDSFGYRTTLDRQVGTSSDDCYRRLYTSYFGASAVAVDAGYSNGGTVMVGAGLRFTNITIPKDATIITAYLIFTCQFATSTDDCNTRISAEDADNPGGFSGDDADSFDTRFSNHTTARVDWDSIPAWSVDEEGVDTTSPEIKAVIQEIVNRAGWSSGNAMVLFWKDFDDRSTHSGGAARRSYSYDGSITKCAKLHIEYSGEAPIVAPTVTNSTGASDITSTTARLNGEVTSPGGENPTVIMYWGDNDGGTTTGNWDNDVNLGTKGTGTFYTDVSGLDTGTTTYYYRCYATNSGGNDWADNTDSFEYRTTLDRQVGTSSDDCYRRLYTSYFGASAVAVDAGYSNGGTVMVGAGLRFTNITIPKDATIITAHLIFTCQFATSTDDCNTRISAEDADNPGGFSGDDADSFDTRFSNHTTARVDWDSIPAWSVDEEGVDTTSPEIKAVIQEIVNRAGWSSGNAMVLFWEDFDDRSTHSGGAARRSYSYDGSITKCAKLHIEYSDEAPEPPDAPTPVSPGTSITFKWNASSGATKYHLQVNTQSDFLGSSMLDSELGDVTTYEVTGLSIGTTYYWRVKAGNAAGWSDWSSPTRSVLAN